MTTNPAWRKGSEEDWGESDDESSDDNERFAETMAEMEASLHETSGEPVDESPSEESSSFSGDGFGGYDSGDNEEQSDSYDSYISKHSHSLGSAESGHSTDKQDSYYSPDSESESSSNPNDKKDYSDEKYVEAASSSSFSEEKDESDSENDRTPSNHSSQRSEYSSGAASSEERSYDSRVSEDNDDLQQEDGDFEERSSGSHLSPEERIDDESEGSYVQSPGSREESVSSDHKSFYSESENSRTKEATGKGATSYHSPQNLDHDPNDEEELSRGERKLDSGRDYEEEEGDYSTQGGSIYGNKPGTDGHSAAAETEDAKRDFFSHNELKSDSELQKERQEDGSVLKDTGENGFGPDDATGEQLYRHYQVHLPPEEDEYSGEEYEVNGDMSVSTNSEYRKKAEEDLLGGAPFGSQGDNLHTRQIDLSNNVREHPLSRVVSGGRDIGGAASADVEDEYKLDWHGDEEESVTPSEMFGAQQFSEPVVLNDSFSQSRHSSKDSSRNSGLNISGHSADNMTPEHRSSLNALALGIERVSKHSNNGDSEDVIERDMVRNDGSTRLSEIKSPPKVEGIAGRRAFEGRKRALKSQMSVPVGLGVKQTSPMAESNSGRKAFDDRRRTLKSQMSAPNDLGFRSIEDLSAWATMSVTDRSQSQEDDIDIMSGTGGMASGNSVDSAPKIPRRTDRVETAQNKEGSLGGDRVPATLSLTRQSSVSSAALDGDLGFASIHHSKRLAKKSSFVPNAGEEDFAEVADVNDADRVPAFTTPSQRPVDQQTDYSTGLSPGSANSFALDESPGEDGLKRNVNDSPSGTNEPNSKYASPSGPPVIGTSSPDLYVVAEEQERQRSIGSTSRSALSSSSSSAKTGAPLRAVSGTSYDELRRSPGMQTPRTERNESEIARRLRARTNSRAGPMDPRDTEVGMEPKEAETSKYQTKSRSPDPEPDSRRRPGRLEPPSEKGSRGNMGWSNDRGILFEPPSSSRLGDPPTRHPPDSAPVLRASTVPSRVGDPPADSHPRWRDPGFHPVWRRLEQKVPRIERAVHSAQSGIQHGEPGATLTQLPATHPSPGSEYQLFPGRQILEPEVEHPAVKEQLSSQSGSSIDPPGLHEKLHIYPYSSYSDQPSPPGWVEEMAYFGEGQGPRGHKARQQEGGSKTASQQKAGQDAREQSKGEKILSAIDYVYLFPNDEVSVITERVKSKANIKKTEKSKKKKRRSKKSKKSAESEEGRNTSDLSIHGSNSSGSNRMYKPIQTEDPHDQKIRETRRKGRKENTLNAAKTTFSSGNSKLQMGANSMSPQASTAAYRHYTADIEHGGTSASDSSSSGGPGLVADSVSKNTFVSKSMRDLMGMPDQFSPEMDAAIERYLVEDAKKSRRKCLLAMVAILLLVPLVVGLTLGLPDGGSSGDERQGALSTMAPSESSLTPPTPPPNNIFVPECASSDPGNLLLQCRCAGTISGLDLDLLQPYNAITEVLSNQGILDAATLAEEVSSCSSSTLSRLLLAELGLRPAKMVEAYALIFLFVTWRGGDWNEQNKWVQTPDLCEWQFVGCDVNQQVTRLSLNRNGLFGTIPSEINLLSSLTELELEGNGLYGRLPPNMYFALSNLRRLDLGSNGLSGQLVGDVPVNAPLNDLRLNGNLFREEIPTTIGALGNLRVLDLSRNLLVGSIPAIFNDLPELEKLDFSECKLTGTIPSSIGIVSEMEILKLNGNRLTGIIPTSLANLEHLVEMNVGRNRLLGSVPDEMCDIPSLDSIFGNCFGTYAVAAGCRCCICTETGEPPPG